MDDKLVEQLTRHINKTKYHFNYEQQGLAFLSAVERSTVTKINIIKDDIVTPTPRAKQNRLNPFAMPYTGLAKIYNEVNKHA